MAAACSPLSTHSEERADAPDWLVVQVWAGRESLSARHLRMLGYEVFLPTYRERRRWSDRIKVVEQPLFAGYVFCRIDAQVVGKCITAPGVIRILCGDRGPLPVPAHEIEAIQRLVDTRLSIEPWPTPRVGQRVRIECGPLEGVEGIVSAIKNRERLFVSISLLNRAVAVELDSTWLGQPLSTLAG